MPRNLSNITSMHIQQLMLEILNHKDKYYFITTDRLDKICELKQNPKNRSALYKARQRYIKRLKDINSLELEYDRSNKRYLLMNSPSFFMKMSLKLSPEMLTAFSAGSIFIQKFLPHLADASVNFQSELEKFFNRDLFEEGRSLASSVTMSLPIAPVDGQIFSLVQKAINEKETVSFNYKSLHSGGKLKLYKGYSPWSVFFAEQSWYLWGSMKGREEGMTCKLCRIKDLDIETSNSYVFPTKDQNPEKVLQSVWSARPGVPKHDVLLAINSPMAEMIMETEWPENVKLTKTDDGVLLSTKVPDLTSMAFFVLKLAPHATVLEPDDLQKMVDEIAVKQLCCCSKTEPLEIINSVVCSYPHEKIWGPVCFDEDISLEH